MNNHAFAESSTGFALEPEDETGVITEIALVLITLCKVIAKPGKHIVELCRADGDRSAQRNIQTAPNDEIKRVIAGGERGDAGKLASLHQIRIRVGVRAAKECLHERLEVLPTILQDRAHVIGKQVPAALHGATLRARAIRR